MRNVYTEPSTWPDNKLCFKSAVHDLIKESLVFIQNEDKYI